MAKNPYQKLKLLYLYQILLQKTDEELYRFGEDTIC